MEKAREHDIATTLRDFGELFPAELTLINACRSGREGRVSTQRPRGEGPANKVRAALVRFLAMGGDDDAPVHETGVKLHGAWIVDILDLDDAVVARPISLTECVIEQIDARRARLRTLNLHGSRLLKGLNGDALQCEGPIFMRHGFKADAPVRLIGAQIGISLDCSSGHFEGDGDTALLLDGAKVAGTIHLDRAHTIGEVRLVHAEIRSGLECHGSRLENLQGDALVCNRAQLGSVCLRDGFYSTGAVRLEGAHVLGSVNCNGGSFDHGAEDGNLGHDEETKSGIALSFKGARIDGALALRGVTRIDGVLDLSDLQAGRLMDDPDSWEASRGELVLDGFVYGRFAGERTDVGSRIAWLDGQMPDHLGKAFRSQPWEQLISVFKAAGHSEDARIVAMEKQKRLRRARKVVRGTRALHWLYGAMVGYGYRPLRLLVAIACVWLACATAYWTAYIHDPPYIVSSSPSDQAGPTTRQPNGNTGEHGGPLDPLVYSADILLPVVDFGHAHEWKIRVNDTDGWGKALRLLYWTEIAFGWLAGALLASAAGTLIKKE